MTTSLSHLDETGAAHMVDVSDKTVTARTAIAGGKVVNTRIRSSLVFKSATAARMSGPISPAIRARPPDAWIAAGGGKPAL